MHVSGSLKIRIRTSKPIIPAQIKQRGTPLPLPHRQVTNPPSPIRPEPEAEESQIRRRLMGGPRAETAGRLRLASASASASASACASSAPEPEPEPEPRLSSAALAISLRILDHPPFGPAYTHQSFDGERIRGHQPYGAAAASVVAAAAAASPRDGTKGRLPHPSFAHHAQATHRVSLSVTLAPSCRTACLQVRTGPKRRLGPPAPGRGPPSSPKAPSPSPRPSSPSRASSSDSCPASASEGSTSGEDDSDSSVGPLGGSGAPRAAKRRRIGEGPREPPPSCHLPSGRTRRRRMGPEEMMERAGRRLPPLVRCDHVVSCGGGGEEGQEGQERRAVPLLDGGTLRQVREDYLAEPVGTVLREYTRGAEGGGEIPSYVLCLADGRAGGVADYHGRVQRLASWFIETASDVDVASNGYEVHKSGGRWAVLYVFQKHAAHASPGGGDRQGGQEGTWRRQQGPRRLLQARSSPGLLSPLVRRAKTSLFSACDGLVSLLSGRRGSAGSPGSQQPQLLQQQLQQQQQQQQQQRSEPTYRYSLVGYTTLFQFYSKPKAGSVMMISQMVVLPPYQRGGHGGTMMRGAHDLAHGAYGDVLAGGGNGERGDDGAWPRPFGEVAEIDVEDPAPQFTALRNRVDLEAVVARGIVGSPAYGSACLVGRSVADGDYFEAPSDVDAAAAAAAVKISPGQVLIALELYKRWMLDEEIGRTHAETEAGAAAGEDGAEAEKEERRTRAQELEGRFEDMVKKRILRVHRQHISGCPGRNEKEAALSILYGETLAHYRTVLKSCRLGRNHR